MWDAKKNQDLRSTLSEWFRQEILDTVPADGQMPKAKANNLMGL
jgi:hypothetical protein